MKLLRRLHVNLVGIAVIIAVGFCWEVSVRSGLVPFDYVPPLSDVGNGLWTITKSGELAANVLHTLTSALTGWLIAAGAGVVIGTALGVSWRLWTVTGASLEMLRALPVVAFVPVAMLVLGFSPQVEVVVATYGALWPVLLNTAAGIRSNETELVDVGRIMQMGPVTTVWKLRLPAAVPSIVIGLRLGMATALVLTLVTEMIGNPAGIGYALVSKAQALQPAQMFAFLIVIGLLGVMLNSVLLLIARLCLPGPMAMARDED